MREKDILLLSSTRPGYMHIFVHRMPLRPFIFVAIPQNLQLKVTTNTCDCVRKYFNLFVQCKFAFSSSSSST